MASNVYIYRAMCPYAGYKILEERFASRTSEQLLSIKVHKQALWLLRESNYPGMLTIDFLYWDEKAEKTACSSTRIALVASGWISATCLDHPSVQKALKSWKKITPELAAEHEKTLQEYIQGYKKAAFVIANRVNPLQSQQSRLPVYSRYTVRIEEYNDVDLPPALQQAITCEITQKPFREPVVLKYDIIVQMEEGPELWLFRGRSYEASSLQALGIKKTDYYPNFLLSKIIDRIGCNDAAKLETLSDARLEDPIMCDGLVDPVILPSGHSFSRIGVYNMIASRRSLRCPITRVPFTEEDLLPNIHLDRFIKAWPECKGYICR